MSKQTHTCMHANIQTSSIAFPNARRIVLLPPLHLYVFSTSQGSEPQFSVLGNTQHKPVWTASQQLWCPWVSWTTASWSVCCSAVGLSCRQHHLILLYEKLKYSHSPLPFSATLRQWNFLLNKWAQLLEGENRAFVLLLLSTIIQSCVPPLGRTGGWLAVSLTEGEQCSGKLNNRIKIYGATGIPSKLAPPVKTKTEDKDGHRMLFLFKYF